MATAQEQPRESGVPPVTALASPDDVAIMIPRVVSQANQLTIETVEDYEYGCSFLTLIATRKKQVGEAYDSIVKKAHESWQEAIAKRKGYLDPLLEAEASVKSKVSTWSIDQERLRKIEEDRLTALAKQQRDEAALAEATALAANGETELADMVIEDAATAPVPIVVAPSNVPKQDGIAKKTTWKWRYKGSPEAALRALVKAAAADDHLLSYLCVNETVVGGEARNKKTLTRIPGIEVYPDHSVSVRVR